jgi:predicted MFS family arabinose efflux permease
MSSFFKDEVGLSPVHVNVLYVCVPVGLSLASVACQRASRVLGRVQAMALFKAVGIALLYLMAWDTTAWRVPKVIIPIYLARTCIMNASYPLQKSILMDYVPKRSRAKWNSLEAITSFGWSGSAALGGWLIQRHGFDVNFTVTATLQLVAWCVMLLLLPLVPRQEGGVAAASAGAAAGEGGQAQAEGGAGAV